MKSEEVIASRKAKKPVVVMLLMVFMLVFSIGLAGCDLGIFVPKGPENTGETEEPEEKEKPVELGDTQDALGFYYITNIEAGNYYYNAKDKTLVELENALSVIIQNGIVKKSYGEARDILAECDQVTVEGETYVRGMYDNLKIATYWIASGTGAWQREHVWPNGRLGIGRVNNSSRNQGSDLHNLRAIGGVNQTRSDRYFEEKSATNITGEWERIGTEAFYPGDADKGDVARILFYMTIMYDFLTLTNDTDALDTYTAYDMSGAKMGVLSLLLKWHKEDPVDDFERGRNEIIFDYQKNRNPFIDHPEFVHLIWEGKTINDLVKPVPTVTADNLGTIVVLYVEEYYFDKRFV